MGIPMVTSTVRAVGSLRLLGEWGCADALLDDVAAVAGPDPALLVARAEVEVDRWCWRQGDVRPAVTAVSAALGARGRPCELAGARQQAGQLGYARLLFAGSEPSARAVAEASAAFAEARELRREHGDEEGAAWATFWLGAAEENLHGDPVAATELYREAQAVAVRLDVVLLRSYTTRHLGALLLGTDLPAAVEHLRSSLALRRLVGFLPGTAAAALALAEALMHAGAPAADVRSLLDEARTLADRLELVRVRAELEELG